MPFPRSASPAPPLSSALSLALKGPAPLSLTGAELWSAFKRSLERSDLSGATEPEQAALAVLCSVFRDFAARLEPRLAEPVFDAACALGDLALSAPSVAARAGALGLMEACDAAGSGSYLENETWSLVFGALSQCFGALCSRLTASAPLDSKLAQACQDFAGAWLDPEADDEFVPEAAGAMLELLMLAAEAGHWPPELLNPADGSLSPARLANALCAIESCEGAQAEFPESLEWALELEPCSRRLGAIVAALPNAEELTLSFASLLGESIENKPPASGPFSAAPLLRQGDLFRGIIASFSCCDWFLAGAIAARPALREERDARGRTPVSLLNDALSKAQDGSKAEHLGWGGDFFKLAERALCEMMEGASDASCLIARPDPVALAASPAVRAAAEAAQMRAATRRAGDPVPQGSPRGPYGASRI